MKWISLFFKVMMVRRVLAMIFTVSMILFSKAADVLTVFTIPSMPAFSMPKAPTVDISPLLAILADAWSRIMAIGQADLLLFSARVLLFLAGTLITIAIVNRIRASTDTFNKYRG